jgi:hypothetical protein
MVGPKYQGPHNSEFCGHNSGDIILIYPVFHAIPLNITNSTLLFSSFPFNKKTAISSSAVHFLLFPLFKVHPTRKNSQHPDP